VKEKPHPWYKRYPSDVLASTLELNAAEKGAYTVLLDLMYARQGPLPDDVHFLTKAIGCSPQAWRKIRAHLFETGKITLTDEGLLANHRVMRELAAVERSHRQGPKSAKDLEKIRESSPKDSQKIRKRFAKDSPVFEGIGAKNNDLVKK